MNHLPLINEGQTKYLSEINEEGLLLTNYLFSDTKSLYNAICRPRGGTVGGVA
jgi:hypothetical protein